MARPGRTTHSISPSPLSTPSYPRPSTCSHRLVGAHTYDVQAQAREQVDARLTLLARTLFGSRSTTSRRRPPCLCPMLDARDDRTPIARMPYGGADAETNHWSDSKRDLTAAAAAAAAVAKDVIPIVTRAPRVSLDGAGSGRNSPSGAGLRSRRTAQTQSQNQSQYHQGHKRSATADEGSFVASASAHPLQPGSPSRMGLSRSAEEGVTRPALKRMLSDNGLWSEENSGSGGGDQDLTRNGVAKSRAGEGEMLVIIHQVRFSKTIII